MFFFCDVTRFRDVTPPSFLNLFFVELTQKSYLTNPNMKIISNILRDITTVNKFHFDVSITFQQPFFKDLIEMKHNIPR